MNTTSPALRATAAVLKRAATRRDKAQLMNGMKKLYKDQVQERLEKVQQQLQELKSGEMLVMRELYWTLGNPRAALAVDSARHGISRVLHDLQRCCKQERSDNPNA